jgi:two-component system LytT family sensor kinase
MAQRAIELTAEDRRGLRRKAVLLTATIWLFLSVLVLVAAIYTGAARVPQVFYYRLGSGLAGFLLCLMIYFLLEKLQARPFSQQMIVTLMSGIPAGLLYLFVERWTLYTISSGRFTTRLPKIPPFLYYQRALFWTFFFLSWAIAILALVYSIKVTIEQRKRAEAQALAYSAQMRALRYQLNPHFLFNTLNSIAALVVDGRADAAELMIRRLSAFLRAGLVADPFEEVELGTEIEQQCLYLEIERIRFPDRLALEVDLPEQLKDALVPGFILQPLVENAVKHGVASSTQRTTITIAAGVRGDDLWLSVQDDGLGADAATPGTGIGLANIRQRLESRFGDNHSFEAKHASPRGFLVRIRIPLRRAVR